MPLIFSLIVMAVMIGALIDIITRDNGQVKHLPKIFWIVLVILLPLVGSIIWFLVGRDYGEGAGTGRISVPVRRVARAQNPAQSPPLPPVDTRTTEQQIADLDREIEEWRLRAEIEKRKREQGGEA